MESEPDHLAKLGLLNRPHHRMTDVLIGHLIRICPHSGIGFKVGEAVKVILGDLLSMQLAHS